MEIRSLKDRWVVVNKNRYSIIHQGENVFILRRNGEDVDVFSDQKAAFNRIKQLEKEFEFELLENRRRKRVLNLFSTIGVKLQVV